MGPSKKRNSGAKYCALLALLTFVSPAAEASLTRATSHAAERPALEIALASTAAAPSDFSLFEGIELAAAAGESASAPSFHPLAAVSLLSKNGAEAPLVSVDELIYPKTRYRVFELLGSRIIGVERGLTLELHWRSASFSCGLSSGTVGWLSQDPMEDRDSPNLYGFVGARPHEKTDPLGLIELPEGPLTTSYSAAASEALNPGNPTAERIAFGILGLLVAPAAGVEQAIHGFLATPERLNRNVPAVVRETKAAIAATDTDTRLRHGAAALGAGSSVVLDVTVIAGLAKSAATATVERELAQASADAASAPVTNSALVRAKPDYTNPQVVEAQVRQNAANALARAQRQGLSGAPGGNAADATFNRANAAFEKRLQDAGSPFGVEVQPARSAAGLPVPARTGGAYTAGSKRLDATIFDRGTGQVRNGFDITISTIKWNSTADNAAYTQRFGISQVEEINPNGPR